MVLCFLNFAHFESPLVLIGPIVITTAVLHYLNYLVSLTIMFTKAPPRSLFMYRAIIIIIKLVPAILIIAQPAILTINLLIIIPSLVPCLIIVIATLIIVSLIDRPFNFPLIYLVVDPLPNPLIYLLTSPLTLSLISPFYYPGPSPPIGLAISLYNYLFISLFICLLITPLFGLVIVPLTIPIAVIATPPFVVTALIITAATFIA